VPGRVGDVLLARSAGGPPRRYVVLADGLQEVPPLVADMLAAASGRAVAEIGPEVVAAARVVRTLAFEDWPEVAPRLVEPGEAPATCWTWSGEPGADPDGRVYVGRVPPAPTPVPLAGADGPGPAPDVVVVGAGGAVRATAAGLLAGAGAVWVVSSSGVAYGVPDDESAAALGITAPGAAPETALRLLPSGPPLAVAAADRLVDVLTSTP